MLPSSLKFLLQGWQDLCSLDNFPSQSLGPSSWRTMRVWTQGLSAGHFTSGLTLSGSTTAWLSLNKKLTMPASDKMFSGLVVFFFLFVCFISFFAVYVFGGKGLFLLHDAHEGSRRKNLCKLFIWVWTTNQERFCPPTFSIPWSFSLRYSTKNKN